MAQALSVTLSSLHATVGMRVDRVTAHVLAHADEHANDRGEIQLGLMAGAHQWALWVNTSKNPRCGLGLSKYNDMHSQSEGTQLVQATRPWAALRIYP